MKVYVLTETVSDFNCTFETKGVYLEKEKAEAEALRLTQESQPSFYDLDDPPQFSYSYDVHEFEVIA